MALKRPEGLSPCYFSLASPDIPDSFVFKWIFRGADSSDYQTKFVITLTDSAKNPLKTLTRNSDNTEVPIEELGYKGFSTGTTYYWQVVTYGRSGVASKPSVYAKFKYDDCPSAAPVEWNYFPQHGDTVVRDTYFQDIKNNVIAVLNDYVRVREDLYTDTQSLFTGDIIPSRTDFVTLNKVLTEVARVMERRYMKDLYREVEDSLGVSDLEYIRKEFQKILEEPPSPVIRLSIDVDAPEMYDITNFQTESSGATDRTIELSWGVTDIPEYSGVFTFNALSTSRDVRYYECLFTYGALSDTFTSTIYLRAEDLENEPMRTFETNWSGLYTSETLGLAKQSLTVMAVDYRGNASTEKTVTKTYGGNFKAPLGLRMYQMEVQRAASGVKTPDPDGHWTYAYNGYNQNYTYRVTGLQGNIFFRLRALDYSGLTTDWVYSGDIAFDPLTKPATPTGLKFTSTTSAVSLTWSAAARAERYEVKVSSTSYSSFYEGTGRSATRSGLASSKSYTFYVRALNRIGASGWASIVGTTKSARVTREQAITKGQSWNTKYAWGSSVGKKYVMQGEWCEIEGSPNRIKSVPVGHCWGKNKGVWLFDSAYWRSTLSGKKILKVEIFVKRQTNEHGYYDDQVPTFWMHNYTSIPSGQPMLFGKYQPGKEFDLGESGWVTLPTFYGEYLRDNKAKGIGTYRDSLGKLPYIKFYPNAKLRITYE